MQQELVSRGVRIVVPAGIARRVHTGRTVERIDLESGVVRDGGLPRRAGHGDGLQIGVFLEGLAGLVDLKVAAGRALRDDLDAHVGKDGAKFI